MELVPYIFFYGRCEEALEFYKSVFGGSYEMMRNSDSPSQEHTPPGFGNKVMHSSFTGGGVSFMASDGSEEKPVDSEAGNIALSVTTKDAAEGERLFKALSDGGKVSLPLGEAFWGGRFADVVDRFGTEWMISTP